MSPFLPDALWTNVPYHEDMRQEGVLVEFTNPNIIGDTSRSVTIHNGDEETVHVWKPHDVHYGWQATGPVWLSDDPYRSRRDLRLGQTLFLHIPNVGHAFVRPVLF